jgi:hypothetical protein
MPFIIAAILGGIVGLLRGGQFNNLTHLPIRWSALPLLALGFQIYVLYGPGREEAGRFGLPALLILASYGLLFVAVLVNRRLPGMMWLGLGSALNFLVILANGGWMPVTAELLATAGFVNTPEAVVPGQRVLFSKDVVMVSQEMHLGWLSDRFVLPKAGPFTMVFSAGDVLMMLGLFRVVQAGMLNLVGQALENADHAV